MPKFSRDFDQIFFFHFYGRDELSQLYYGSTNIIAYLGSGWRKMKKKDKIFYGFYVGGRIVSDWKEICYIEKFYPFKPFPPSEQLYTFRRRRRHTQLIINQAK